MEQTDLVCADVVSETTVQEPAAEPQHREELCPGTNSLACGLSIFEDDFEVDVPKDSCSSEEDDVLLQLLLCSLLELQVVDVDAPADVEVSVVDPRESCTGVSVTLPIIWSARKQTAGETVLFWKRKRLDSVAGDVVDGRGSTEAQLGSTSIMRSCMAAVGGLRGNGTQFSVT